MAEQHTPRSLIVTYYGAYGRRTHGPVPVAELIRLPARYCAGHARTEIIAHT